MAEYLDKTGLTYLCSKIKAKFDAKADKTTADALGKRIDNLILSSGTESSAEVVDARNGYDGTTYDTLGTAIRSQVSELKSDLAKQGFTSATYDIPYPSGAYVDNDGNIVEYPSYLIYRVSVNDGDVIRASVGGSGFSAIALFNSDMTYANVNVVHDNGEKTYELKSTINGYALVTSVINYNGLKISKMLSGSFDNILDTKIEMLKENIGLKEYNKEDLLTGKYVYKDTGLEVELSAYSVTDFINIKDRNVTIITNVGDDVSGMCFYDANRQFVSGMNTYEYNNTEYTPNIPNDAYYIRVSCLTSNIDSFSLKTDKNIKQSFDLDILSAFTNITCCGDSLTWGHVYTSANEGRQAYKPYPNILGGRTGANVESYAYTGYDATDWWNNYNENIIQKDNQLVIVYLGTNNGLTDTLETDAIGNDYTTYANTNTGNYCKLVRKAQILGAKVLLIKLFGSSGNYIVSNNVIDKIAEKFAVAVVENPRVVNPILEEDKFHNYPSGNGVNWAHYNDLGYSAFVDELMRDVGNLSNLMMSRLIPN